MFIQPATTDHDGSASGCELTAGACAGAPPAASCCLSPCRRFLRRRCLSFLVSRRLTSALSCCRSCRHSNPARKNAAHSGHSITSASGSPSGSHAASRCDPAVGAPPCAALATASDATSEPPLGQQYVRAPSPSAPRYRRRNCRAAIRASEAPSILRIAQTSVEFVIEFYIRQLRIRST